MSPLPIFVGYDTRQPVAFHVAAQSLLRHASRPLAIAPLVLSQLPITRSGRTEFTYSRFLVPWLCAYQGLALFLDSDMLIGGDVAELFEGERPDCDLELVREQPRGAWCSLMLFHCERCRTLTPEWIEDRANDPLALGWAIALASLPSPWNCPVGYGKDSAGAKALHFTAGVPVWEQTRRHPEDRWWHEELARVQSSCGWAELMGPRKC